MIFLVCILFFSQFLGSGSGPYLGPATGPKLGTRTATDRIDTVQVRLLSVGAIFAGGTRPTEKAAVALIGDASWSGLAPQYLLLRWPPRPAILG